MMITFAQAAEWTNGTWKNLPANFDLEQQFSVVSTDTRVDLKDALFIALKGENFDAHLFLDKAQQQGATAVVVNATFEITSEISLPLLEVTETGQAYLDLAAGWRGFLRTEVVGITGSCGKTSCKSILSQLLQCYAPMEVHATAANLNNTVGVPLTLLGLTEQHKFAVVEMGMNQPGEICRLATAASATVCLLTNVGESHVGNFTDKQAVFNEKADIFRFTPRAKALVYPFELKAAVEAIADKNVVQYTFGKEEDADFRLLDCQVSRDECNFSFRLPDGSEHSAIHHLGGEAQALNVLASFAVLHSLYLPLYPATQSLPACSIPGMRLSWTKKADYDWLLDCYNANPQSTRAFIDYLAASFPEKDERSKVAVVLGDMLELGEHSQKLHSEVLAYAMQKLPGCFLITVGAHYAHANKAHSLVYSRPDAYDAAQLLLHLHLKEHSVIALKGSRGIKLETIYEHLSNPDAIPPKELPPLLQ